MPISTADRDLYPQDWQHLAWNVVVRRAGGRCQCTGHCGGDLDHLEPGDGQCRNRHGHPRWSRGGWRTDRRPVILSAAHLDHDPEVRDLDRIIGLCEPCHLRFDLAQHQASRRRNFERRAGLIPLFELV